jgi:hypothetical protein
VIRAATHARYEKDEVDVLRALARARARTDASRIFAALDGVKVRWGISRYAFSARDVLVQLEASGASTDFVIDALAQMDATGSPQWSELPSIRGGANLRGEVVWGLVSRRLETLSAQQADRIAAATHPFSYPGHDEEDVLEQLIGRASASALEHAAALLSPEDRKSFLDALARRSAPR